MPRATIQVFEHERIRVGQPVRTADGGEYVFSERHHAALAGFADSTGDRYLRFGRSTVRFTAYVGFLQLGELGIEVLPKADKNHAPSHGGGEHQRWHRALVRMLRVTGDLGLEARDEAQLQTNPGRLFDLFVDRFMDECQRLLHEGLAKTYRTEEGNRVAFRGRLMVSEHVRHNAANGARFYVASPVYDHRSLPNLALVEALRVVETLPISSAARSRARQLRRAFPDLPPWRPDQAALGRLRLNRQTTRYRDALRIARLILFHLAPDIRSGPVPLLALLFDMNRLWERYVATMARRVHLPGLSVHTQAVEGFWKGSGAMRTLRPDIVLLDDAGRTQMVIDTKWKVPDSGRAGSNDLKQMFCYHELFRCERTMLLFPQATGATKVEDTGRYTGTQHECALAFLSVDGDLVGDLRGLLSPALERAEPLDALPSK